MITMDTIAQVDYKYKQTLMILFLVLIVMSNLFLYFLFLFVNMIDSVVTVCNQISATFLRPKILCNFPKRRSLGDFLRPDLTPVNL